jgi:Ca2+-binding EF-hand superfamily protein
LIDPIIGLGFVDHPSQVKSLVACVDQDGDTRLEFHEFLQIIRQCDQSDSTKDINRFFKDLTAGKFANEGLSFQLFVSGEKRKNLKNAVYGSGLAKEKGVKIMSNIK